VPSGILWLRTRHDQAPLHGPLHGPPGHVLPPGLACGRARALPIGIHVPWGERRPHAVCRGHLPGCLQHHLRKLPRGHFLPRWRVCVPTVRSAGRVLLRLRVYLTHAGYALLCGVLLQRNGRGYTSALLSWLVCGSLGLALVRAVPGWFLCVLVRSDRVLPAVHRCWAVRSCRRLARCGSSVPCWVLLLGRERPPRELLLGSSRLVLWPRHHLKLPESDAVPRRLHVCGRRGRPSRVR
jgi:hypothetical protein